MEKVVVIGADGFLGSRLVLELASRGYSVFALAFEGGDSIPNLDNVCCRKFSFDKIGDISVPGYDTVFNMAWAGVNSDLKNEPRIQAQNILYGLDVMEFAVKNGIRKVVFPGSASEVSCGNGVITGREVPAPSDFYAASKVATRYISQTFASKYRIDLVWTLITSIYGPGRNDNNLISYSIKTLLKSEKPSFTKLEQMWDYLYIDDLMEALVSLGEKGKGGKVYPVGSGEHHRMNEYVSIIRDRINPLLPLGVGDYPYKNATIDNQVLDISALKEDTGFSPKVSFEEGIDRTIEYFKNL